MEYTIKKGGHKDLHRIYPMLQADFMKFELLAEFWFQRALVNNAMELLLLKDEAGVEAGYAIIYKKSLYGYVLLAYIGVYPTGRGNGVGRTFLRLINERYAARQGVILEVTGIRENEKAARLRGFYGSEGYEEVPCHYLIGGQPGILMCLPRRGSANLANAASPIIRDIYSQIVPERMIEKCASS
ncbi:MAG: GNAT family N-acetyltransferase, partial [Oscillospiraceae bacterium]